MLYEFLYINGSSTKPGLRWTLKSTSLINTKNNSGLGDESLSFDSRCDWEMIFELASTTCFHQNHCIELLAHNEQGVGQTFTLGLVAYNEQGTPSVGLWIEWPLHGSNSIVKSEGPDRRPEGGEWEPQIRFEKNRREKSRLHPTHLGRRVSVLHSSERLSALGILLTHNLKLDREKSEQNLTSSTTQTKIRAKRSESQNISETRTKGLEHR